MPYNDWQSLSASELNDCVDDSWNVQGRWAKVVRPHLERQGAVRRTKQTGGKNQLLVTLGREYRSQFR